MGDGAAHDLAERHGLALVDTAGVRLLLHRRAHPLRKYRIIKVVDWRVNFSSDAPANFAGLLAVSQGICRMQLAEKALPSVAAVLCGISYT